MAVGSGGIPPTNHTSVHASLVSIRRHFILLTKLLTLYGTHKFPGQVSASEEECRLSGPELVEGRLHDPELAEGRLPDPRTLLDSNLFQGE